ncbi:Universal stress protein [Methylocella tundrae]|uniref:Universal stress protein n=1 Tax=Methylocella tundrae TaxID=227605 RepID=A0A4U8Z230_METTU|nr:universal stress protein [Methylocella tundrae]WPP03377.1 universal stress protein [Methylocella tundrae]VFU09424.1 Universal stress protein [Methylocella tundrae]VTZ28386.1 Universal stress protein [Methylocella tundrae]VTZ48301.1 Universal stress protein [Methylocella tundrae]
MYSNILIPTDGSELASKAVSHGVELAKAIGAKVTILTVTLPFRVFSAEAAMIEDTPDDYTTRLAEQAEKTLGEASAVAVAAGVPVETLQVEDDRPYQAIIDTAASKGADLIIMASHGRKGISALILGSETSKVLTHCKVPVLVHR